MRLKYRYSIFIIIVFGLLLKGCVEPFEFETEDFESALVVEATLTNKIENQVVLLSRSYALEDNGPLPELAATVNITSDHGNIYNLEETAPGKYVSTLAFGAERNVNYTLSITTSNGRNYTSDPAGFTGESQIDDIYARPAVNLDGENGVEILVDSRGAAGSSGYYKYEYIETYKFVSPMFKNIDIVQVGDSVEMVPKTKEEFTCFRTHLSQEIILDNTTSQAADRTTGKFLRFILRRDPIFSQRYSILVKQFGLSREAFAFYQSLKELSESESLFSQIQPGFLAGNMYSLDNPNENVLGFFAVASLAEKRVYFNYDDFYSGSDGPRPNFNNYCPLWTPDNNTELLRYTNDPTLRFYEFNPGFGPPTPGQFTFVRAQCVDCTLTGSNEVPEFWEE